MGEVERLPSLPAPYDSFMANVDLPQTEVRDLGAIASGDVGMSAKVLHLVNTSFFGPSNNAVINPVEAVEFLGLETVTALALTAEIFERYEPSATPLEWPTSACTAVAVAARARVVCRFYGADERTAEHAFVAGLLHDAGKLVLAARLPEDYGRAVAMSDREAIPLAEAERGVFGASHAEVGAYLIGLWGLSGPVLDALACHHWPRLSKQPRSRASALTAVHLANAYARQHDSHGRAYLTGPVDREYLESLQFDVDGPTPLENLPVAPNGVPTQ